MKEIQARLTICTLTASLAAVVWTPAAASLLNLLGTGSPPLAGRLVFTASLVGAIAGFAGATHLRLRALLYAACAGAIGFAPLVATGWIRPAPALSVWIVALPCALLAGALVGRLPESLEDEAGRAPRWAVLWLIVSVLCVVQVGRLASFVTNQETPWHLATTHPFWNGHLCLPGYIYAAELNERGEPNIYEQSHYLAPTLETRFDLTAPDEFLYPPPFLLLPRLAISLTSSFQVLYSLWFSIQATVFVVVAIWLALWVGGRAGRNAALLSPLLLLALPTLFTLQYGQFHLATLVLSVAAMLLFDRKKNTAGALLAGFALVSKIFPGILLVWLAARRQWKPVFGILTACVFYAGIGFLVVGGDAYGSFVGYTLPRLSSGAAFDFSATAPDLVPLVVTDLLSPYGVILKLDALGVPGMSKSLGAGLGKLFALALVVMTYLAARRLGDDRAGQAAVWLALLGFGSLVNPGAWGDYVTLPAVWLLTFCTVRMCRDRRALVGLSTAWIFQFFLIGTMPILDKFHLPLFAALSLVNALVLYGLYVWILAVLPSGDLETGGRLATPIANRR